MKFHNFEHNFFMFFEKYKMNQDIARKVSGRSTYKIWCPTITASYDYKATKYITQTDKIRVINMLNNVSEEYKNMSTLIPVTHLKRTRNYIHKLIYELNKLYSE